ncbi:MAG: geranyl transferase, partial [Gammaproteobacteria bacterium]|nr:geranyl transferase [Gammaproteobacteria bacterium]
MTPELESVKYQINNALEATLPKNSVIAQPIVDAMRHSVLGGGKRIRPLLACATCMAFETPIRFALAPACAAEFIHAYSLIHDDLPAMDDDDLRHGLPSAHVAFGEANAILAGDSLHSLAFQTIACAEQQNAQTKLQMIELLAEAAGWAGMAGGQCLDIAAEGANLSLTELQTLHAAKTGALIRVAVQLGALSANTVSPSQEQFFLLTEFGDRIGLAFQVMDDVLDVTQSTEKLGKPAGSDEAADKST